MVRINLKEQERENRRRAIIDAALSLFARKDFHEVTVDEIAEQIGLSKGTLYLYFKNKEDLFFSIIQEKTDQLFGRLQEAMSQGETFIERMENLIRSYLLFFEEHRSFYHIIHSEKTRLSGEETSRLHTHVKQSFLQFEKMLCAFFQTGLKEGVLRKKLSPDLMANVLRGVLNSFTFQHVFTGGGNPLVDQTSQIMDVLKYGIMNAVEAKQGG